MSSQMRSPAVAVLVCALVLTVVPAAGAQTEARLQERIEEAAAAKQRAERELGTAEERLGQLEAEFQRAVDAFNTASEELAALESEVAVHARDVERFRELSETARDDVRQSARTLYISGPSVGLPALLAGVDAAEVTRRLTFFEAARTSRLAAAESYASDQRRYAASLAHLERSRDAAQAKREEVARLRTEIEAKVASQEEEISALQDEIAAQAEQQAANEQRLAEVRAEQARREAAARAQRERAAQSQTTDDRQSAEGQRRSGDSQGAPSAKEPAPSGPAASGKAAVAVQTALAQVGKPYQWGGSGPSSFDCSGLTSYAWRAAGVSLPHNSQMQYNATARVSRDDLRPGDLLFFYSPISHVGIYIGNGQMVDAPYSGKDVRVRSIFRGDFVGAGRPRY